MVGLMRLIGYIQSDLTGTGWGRSDVVRVGLYCACDQLIVCSGDIVYGMIEVVDYVSGRVGVWIVDCVGG